MRQTDTAKHLPVGHSFTDHNLPEPHEFVGQITEALPVAKIKCSCGYDGLAVSKNDGQAFDCPACQGRADHQKRLMGQTVNEVGRDEVAVAEMVNSAVNKAVGPLMDLIAKLQAQAEPKKVNPSTKPSRDEGVD
jgi:hypothetical protein